MKRRLRLAPMFLLALFWSTDFQPARADLLAVDWIGNAWWINECTGEVIDGPVPTGHVGLNSLARDAEGRMLAVGTRLTGITQPQYLLEIDPGTGLSTEIAPLTLDGQAIVALTQGTVRALAIDPDGTILAALKVPTATAGHATLYTIDPVSGAMARIGDIVLSDEPAFVTGVQAMTFSPDGILYGYEFMRGLIVIDPSRGQSETLDLVIDGDGLSVNSLAFSGDQLFAALQVSLALDPRGGSIKRVDLAQGRVTLVGEGPYRDVRGIEFIPGTERDIEPPTVALSVATRVLQPPNGRMVNVGLQFTVADNEDPAPLKRIQVYCNENAPGSAFLADNSLLLKSDRLGNGSGRIYLIVVQATDACRNIGFECTTVVVPRKSSAAALASILEQAAQAESSCRETWEPTAGFQLILSGDIP